VRLNGLQFNANRDPQVSAGGRRAVPIQALVDAGAGVRCTADANGQSSSRRRLPRHIQPRTEVRAPGVHVVTLVAARDGQSFTQDLRLDVLAHAWVG
jgi:hypothetical protein